MIRGDEKRQFLVTLPSNACDDKYPKNRPGNYKTSLAVPVELGDDWEVALVDVQYPPSWYNFVHKTRIVIGLIPGRDAGVVIAPDTTTAYKFPSGVPKKPTPDEQFQIKVNAITHTKVMAAEITMMPGHYDSVNQFGETVAHLFNDAFDKLFFNGKHKLSVGYKMDPTNTYSFFTFQNMDKAYLLANNEYTMNVLGCVSSGKTGTGTDADPHVYEYGMMGIRSTDDHVKTQATRVKAALSRAFSVYVYSDVVKPQLVGDVRAPLLGVVPVVNPSTMGTDGNHTSDKLQYWCFNPTYYMPLRITSFDTIDILLCTDEGMEVMFGHTLDKVVCRLHFQRRASSGI